MAPSNALYWLTIGIVWIAVGSEPCERDEIFPFLDFPYFKAHLHIGESLICRFRSPNDQKAYVKWKCMTPRLFEGIGPYKRNVAVAKLRRLQIPNVIYHFKNNWCSCWIRLHRVDGTTCDREVTQFVEFLPRPNAPSGKVARVSIGATKLSWLHDDVVASGCPSINLCRDERYPRNSFEDTKMVLKEIGPFRNAIRPYPRIEFGNSFRYPFAVLDICKMKKSGLYFYTCIHRDQNRGPEEKMYLNLTWRATQRKIKNKGSSKPRNHQKALKNKLNPVAEKSNASRRRKPASQKKTKPTTKKTNAPPESAAQTKKGRKIKKGRRPMVKVVKHYNRPQVSSRYQQRESLRHKFQNMYKAIHMKSQKLKERSAKLDQTLTGVKIAVVGCVLLVMASLAWFYHGTQLRNRYRQQAKFSSN